MAVTTTPTQSRYLEPFKNRAFQYDAPDSNLFLSRYANNILRVFGDDVVLSGAYITNITWTTTNVDFDVDPGKVIQDLTYVNYDGPESISYDVSTYVDTLKIIVYLNYQFLHTVQSNPLQLRAAIYDPSGTTVLDGWDPQRDRIVLGLINFVKVAGDVVSASLDSAPLVIIDGDTYYIRPEPDNNPIDPIIDGGEIP